MFLAQKLCSAGHPLSPAGRWSLVGGGRGYGVSWEGAS